MSHHETCRSVGDGYVMGSGVTRRLVSRRVTPDPITDPSPTERGVALVITLLVMVLLTALGLSLTLVTSTERRVAAAHRHAVETFYLADAALARVVADVAGIADWSHALDGTVSAAWGDAGATVDRLPDGSPLDLPAMTGQVTCGRPSCTPAEMDATTRERPWGVDNPRWRLFAHGPAAALGPPGAIDSSAYVLAWVGDDPLESDGNPLRDGDTTGGPNPGVGRLVVLVHAFGPGGSRQVLTATVARQAAGVRVVAWRLAGGV